LPEATQSDKLDPVIDFHGAADGAVPLTMAEADVAGVPQVLICDRDRKWSGDVRRRLRDAGVRVVLITGSPVIDEAGRVRRCPRLGGLLNFYERAA
jgi:hypothetical protein